MVLLVPFDGSQLATAALERAGEFGEFSGEDVLVLSVVPDDAAYARDRGWIGLGDDFVPDLVAGDLERQARRVVPDATF
jgi:nucleotide-binding universal stress UspA family protein